MKKMVLLFIIGVSTFQILYAQFTFRVGQSTDNTYTKGESAKLQYTQPSSGTAVSSWLVQGYVDGGYAFKWGTRNHFVVSANGELQRNTLIEKKQDVRQLGMSLDFKREFLGAGGSATSMLNPTLSIKHSDDHVKGKESMQYILGVTYFAAANATTASDIQKLFTPGLYCPIFKETFGLVFDHNVSGVIMNEQSMYLSMIQANAGVNVYLLPIVFDSLVSYQRTLFVYANWNGRHAFQNEVDNDMKAMRKIGIGLDFSLFSTESKLISEEKKVSNRIMIKYEWVNGADPLKGLANQKYRQLTLNLVLNI